MMAFRISLGLVIVALGTDTTIVGMHHGWNLLPILFADIAIARRHEFSAGGRVLGVLGFFGGMMVLAPDVRWATGQANGNLRVVLLGSARACG